jgi:hypothetical protein
MSVLCCRHNDRASVLGAFATGLKRNETILYAHAQIKKQKPNCPYPLLCLLQDDGHSATAVRSIAETIVNTMHAQRAGAGVRDVYLSRHNDLLLPLCPFLQDAAAALPAPYPLFSNAALQDEQQEQLRHNFYSPWRHVHD